MLLLSLKKDLNARNAPILKILVSASTRGLIQTPQLVLSLAKLSQNSIGGRVLAQAQPDLVLVATVWKSQTWYPALLEMCKDFPRIIAESHDLSN